MKFLICKVLDVYNFSSSSTRFTVCPRVARDTREIPHYVCPLLKDKEQAP